MTHSEWYIIENQNTLKSPKIYSITKNVHTIYDYICACRKIVFYFACHFQKFIIEVNYYQWVDKP